jgi:hypothetical protein
MFKYSKIMTNSVVTSSKGPNKACLYKSVGLGKVFGGSGGELFFKKQYRPAGVLFNGKAVFCYLIVKL